MWIAQKLMFCYQPVFFLSLDKRAIRKKAACCVTEKLQCANHSVLKIFPLFVGNVTVLCYTLTVNCDTGDSFQNAKEMSPHRTFPPFSQTTA